MKPDFSSEDLDCDNVLDCLYNLSRLDKEILELLKGGDEYRSKEIAEMIDRDQSTAYRSLEKLVNCGLIYKEKQTIRNGGYFFLYSSRPLKNVKEEALECIDRWYDEMKRAINDMKEV